MQNSPFKPLQRLSEIVFFLSPVLGFGWIWYGVLTHQRAFLREYGPQAIGYTIALMGVGGLFMRLSRQRIFNHESPTFYQPLPDPETLRQRFQEWCRRDEPEQDGADAKLAALIAEHPILHERYAAEQRLSVPQRTVLSLAIFHTPPEPFDPVLSMGPFVPTAMAAVVCGVTVSLLPLRLAAIPLAVGLCGGVVFSIIRYIRARTQQRAQQEAILAVDLSLAQLLDEPAQLVDAYRAMEACEPTILRVFDSNSPSSYGVRARRLTAALEEVGEA